MNASVQKALKILTYLAESAAPMGVSQLAAALGYPKSSVFDILESLRAEEYIEWASESARTYRVGVQAFRTGCAYTAQMDLCRMARPVLTRLSAETGASAYLAAAQGSVLLYLDRADGASPVRTGGGRESGAAHADDDHGLGDAGGRFGGNTAARVCGRPRGGQCAADVRGCAGVRLAECAGGGDQRVDGAGGDGRSGAAARGRKRSGRGGGTVAPIGQHADADG